MLEFEKTLMKFIEEIQNLPPIESADIPNIDLYMDQATTFMDAALVGFKRQSDDKVLTKTMINNYAKAKIFPPPVKKKYTKNHMMLLIIIYHLKAVLSIQDISDLLKPITDELNKNANSTLLDNVYACFVKLQIQNNNTFLSSLLDDQAALSEQGALLNQFEDEKVKLILVVLLLAIRANTEKRLAEKILDSYFKPLPAQNKK